MERLWNTRPESAQTRITSGEAFRPGAMRVFRPQQSHPARNLLLLPSRHTVEPRWPVRRGRLLLMLPDPKEAGPSSPRAPATSAFAKLCAHAESKGWAVSLRLDVNGTKGPAAVKPADRIYPMVLSVGKARPAIFIPPSASVEIAAKQALGRLGIKP